MTRSAFNNKFDFRHIRNEWKSNICTQCHEHQIQTLSTYSFFLLPLTTCLFHSKVIQSIVQIHFNLTRAIPTTLINRFMEPDKVSGCESVSLQFFESMSLIEINSMHLLNGYEGDFFEIKADSIRQTIVNSTWKSLRTVVLNKTKYMNDFSV